MHTPTRLIMRRQISLKMPRLSYRLRKCDEVPFRCQQELKLKLNCDRQSVGQSVLVSGTHLGPVTNFSFSLKFSLDSLSLLFCSALSDERTGL
jgi:hypothetical protein